MKALVTKLGVLAMALGSVVLTAAPSFAWGYGCHGGEVGYRDAVLNSEINHDRGFLRGHYNQLRGEDFGIRQQARVEAAMNGGFLTPGERWQLNREENNLQRQINYDHRGF